VDPIGWTANGLEYDRGARGLFLRGDRCAALVGGGLGCSLTAALAPPQRIFDPQGEGNRRNKKRPWHDGVGHDLFLKSNFRLIATMRSRSKKGEAGLCCAQSCDRPGPIVIMVLPTEIQPESLIRSRLPARGIAYCIGRPARPLQGNGHRCQGARRYMIIVLQERAPGEFFCRIGGSKRRAAGGRMVSSKLRATQCNQGFRRSSAGAPAMPSLAPSPPHRFRPPRRAGSGEHAHARPQGSNASVGMWVASREDAGPRGCKFVSKRQLNLSRFGDWPKSCRLVRPRRRSRPRSMDGLVWTLNQPPAAGPR
jgi:hypothetical protein